MFLVLIEGQDEHAVPGEPRVVEQRRELLGEPVVGGADAGVVAVVKIVRDDHGEHRHASAADVAVQGVEAFVFRHDMRGAERLLHVGEVEESEMASRIAGEAGKAARVVHRIALAGKALRVDRPRLTCRFQ